jgi:hypothetical protein
MVLTSSVLQILPLMQQRKHTPHTSYIEVKYESAPGTFVRSYRIDVRPSQKN